MDVFNIIGLSKSNGDIVSFMTAHWGRWVTDQQGGGCSIYRPRSMDDYKKHHKCWHHRLNRATVL